MAYNALLLQGPMGPFFKHFAKDLQARGYTVYKINLNAGDKLFFHGKNAIDYTGDINGWAEFLKLCLADLKIDAIFLFGDQRPYHRVAAKVADFLDIDLFVFEEGYLRPHYITLEKNGVNGHSTIPRIPEYYEGVKKQEVSHPTPVPHAFFYMACYAIIYYVIGWLGSWGFPHYIHHRSFNPFSEAVIWLRAAFRKYYYHINERGILKRLTTTYANRYYLVPLQVHNDAQIRAWSNVPSAAAFIRRVISSFAKHAPSDSHLVIKHHPLDRGYSDYTGIIDKLARKYDCRERISYIHDLHLPTLLSHAKGTVLLNSTVGLSSILHGTPVKTLGHAIYALEGLTYQGALTTFWQDQGNINQQLNQQFRSYLLGNNQINGNFYRRIPGYESHSGIDFEHLVKLIHRQQKARSQEAIRTQKQFHPEHEEVADVTYTAPKQTSAA
jgi:capsule polysaccharide modification protein KpsS